MQKRYGVPPPDVVYTPADAITAEFQGYEPWYWSKDLGKKARFAAAVLANKAKLYGEAKAIERWNGRGRAEDADAAYHAGKVNRAMAMLAHPWNKELAALVEQAIPAQPATMSLGQIGGVR